MSETEFRAFCQSVIDNIKKNGFPEKKVAFSLERMYEVAYNKGINFNKVLDKLREIQIDHEKTPEKVIFFPIAKEPEPAATFNPLESLGGINPEMFKNMDMSSMIEAASQMMQNMSPDQLKSIKEAYENMSDEERAELMEQAKKMGMG